MPTSLEQQIIEIWADVLEIEQVTPTDNFFDLGGSSLQAVRIISRTEERFGVHLSVLSVLATRNVHEMASQVQQALACLQVQPKSG